MMPDKVTVRFGVALLTMMVLTPFIPQWAMFILTITGANGLVVLGLMLFLRAGLVSFGQALFFCAGAYTTGLLALTLGLREIFVLLPLSALVAGVLAYLLGFLLAKYRAIFFGLLSLAFSMILYGLLVKTEALGSTDGFNVPAVTIFGWAPASDQVRQAVLGVTSVIIILCVAFVNSLLKSPRGLLLTAIRDNEIRAEYMGASARKTIHLIYVIAGVLSGFAGAIAAIAVGHIDPAMAFWTTSGEFIFITILSGIGSVAAPFIGALVFGIIHTVAFSYSPNTWQGLIGLSLIFVILLLPNGLWSLVSKFKRRQS
ncbi:branched-chain amino acid ABC transporter permease [Alcaligenaceae bacterium LF4-65]|jgi:branched-chain amino acid transport system permease protein|uniref:Branched-chain amino acid ABC transporter permease n=1 Tax=Zwartia hollandica TaxID=324606 RepID=A0A953NAK1_9BURK|nr:branched-chain amino acid ABC transporter permease [Zwartia hollandica]MBZ1349755.1 branched-chain amino acid ABC transporter permease [Zwartia hollandica]